MVPTAVKNDGVATPSEPSLVSTDQELSWLLLQAIVDADQPITIPAALKQLPASVRPDPMHADQILRGLVADGTIHLYPEIRGQAQFWNHPPRILAAHQLTRKSQRGPCSEADLVRDVGSLKALSGISKAELKRIFHDLVKNGQLHKLPPFLGARTVLFSASPINPHDYLDDAISKLSKKLSIAPEILLGRLQRSQPTQPFNVEPVNVASPPTIKSSDEVHDERIIEAMKELDPRVTSGAMVSIADLRRTLSANLPDEDFDRMMLAQSAAGRIAIHRFDRGNQMSEDQRRELLRDESGNLYNTVSLRQSKQGA